MLELTKRLNAVYDVLQRRPLIIADQFDDYQAQHRHNFLDADGNWLAPAELADHNPFWNLLSKRLRDESLHLLAVTRSDTSSGLSCIRFLDNTMTAVRTLPRVDVEYLRPLLVGIAPDEATPPVVSNPENGWQALRERLEMDFRARGAILMQQVRTVLLGLRQLPTLRHGPIGGPMACTGSRRWWSHARCARRESYSAEARQESCRTGGTELDGAAGRYRSAPPRPSVSRFRSWGRSLGARSG